MREVCSNLSSLCLSSYITDKIKALGASSASQKSKSFSQLRLTILEGVFRHFVFDSAVVDLTLIDIVQLDGLGGLFGPSLGRFTVDRLLLYGE